MNKILENMINKKIYEKEDMISKLDLFVLFNRIKIEDYTTLMQLILDVYIEIEGTVTDLVQKESETIKNHV